MYRLKKLTGTCDHCGLAIEFDAHVIGTVAPCPFCQKPTELRLAQPPDVGTLPKKSIAWTIVAIVILTLGLVASLLALNRARDLFGSGSTSSSTNGGTVPSRR